MYVILYILIFIIGTLFGSFFSLAIYRIPLKQDITHERSYCPKCNHRLEFLDLIPILSYVFLGGKCRYCKEKIRPRYILLELFSGILFLLFAISLKINIYNLEIQKLIYLLFGMFYISTLFIMAGIEKEIHSIPNSILVFGLILETIYIIYLYIIKISIYKYVIYLLLMLILVFINYAILKKKGSNNYTIQILTLCMYLCLGTSEDLVIINIILTLLLIAIKQMQIARKSKENKKIPIGFYLCCVNILTLIIQNFIMQ